MVLGIHFSWRFTKSDVVIHMNQSGCSTNLIKQFARDSWESSPTALPSRSCVPINSIAPSTDDDTSPVQLRCTEAYQSFIWLATNTRPNLAPVHSFLSSYSGKPSSGLMRAALYTMPFIISISLMIMGSPSCLKPPLISILMSTSLSPLTSNHRR